MATFEVDTDIVKSFLKEAPFERLAIAELAVELERQIPQPLPPGMGAVLKLGDGRTAVRADGSEYCWCVHTSDTFNDWLTNETLPRPFTVLSKGVQD